MWPPTGVIGMVHLPPLPGSPRWAGPPGDFEPVLERAASDARTLADGGVDAVLVENYGDAPFHRDRVEAVTIAAMTRAVAAVREAVDRPVGVNVLRNDARAALAVAAATGATFIRVNVHTGGMYTDQGWIEGRAAETLRLRSAIAPGVAILADVLVKHATPPAGLTLADAARDAWHRGLADALVVSGPATGAPTEPDRVAAVREAVPGAVVLVGSGVTAATVAAALSAADGVIVGSALEADGVAGGPVELDRVRRLVRAAR
ncbi:MAG: BtpA/SgcQ family protein [Gemmatimonadota bacterium]